MAEQPKTKRGCEIVEESKSKDINETAYNEAPARYMAAPKKLFWELINKIRGKK